MRLFDNLIPFIDLMDIHELAACCTGVVITNVVSVRSTIVKIVGPLILVYRVGGGVGLLCGCLSLGHHVGWHHGLLCTLLHVIVKVCHIWDIPLHEVYFSTSTTTTTSATSTTPLWDGQEVLLWRHVVLLLWSDCHEHDVLLIFLYLLLQLYRLSLTFG